MELNEALAALGAARAERDQLAAEVERLRDDRRSGTEAVHVGAKLYGFCGGMFGRESYGDKVVEALGYDWCVAREDNGDVAFGYAHGRDIRESLVEYATKREDEW